MGGGIGDCVSIGVNTVVRNPNIPDNCVVYQDVCTGMITQRPNGKSVCYALRNYFKEDNL